MIQRLVIHQPYFVPYLGYYQAIAASDLFIVLESQYVKNSFINRNKIWSTSGKVEWLTIPVESCPLQTSIDEVLIAKSFDRNKFFRTLTETYGKERRFDEVCGRLFPDWIFKPGSKLSKHINLMNRAICNYLDITVPFVTSGFFGPEFSGLRGKDKVLALCDAVGAAEYLNAPGGKALYSKEEFESRGIKLKFNKPFLPEYSDRKGNPVPPGLSVLDVIMRNERDQVIAWTRSNEIEEAI